MLLSARDRRILDLALARCDGSTFRDALAALKAAVEESIPNGRIFILGHDGPIVGSHVSGIGLTADLDIVRVRGGVTRIGRFG